MQVVGVQDVKVAAAVGCEAQQDPATSASAPPAACEHPERDVLFRGVDARRPVRTSGCW